MAKKDKETDKKPKKNDGEKRAPKSTGAKKKRILLISFIAGVILVFAAVAFFIIKKTPYIELKGIEILSAKNIYSNPIYTYTTDTEGEVIDIDSDFENTSATFKFYDYSVSEPDEDGNETTTFKYDTTVPIKFTRNDYTYKDKYYYTYSISRPIFFDRYTGEEYQKYTSRSDSDEETQLKTNEISWNGKTYKIGIRTETSSTWDGKKQESKDVYIDTNKVTTTVYISAPKGYDGLMAAIFKLGSTEERFKKTLADSKKLDELKKQAEETGEKSKELIKLEEKQNKTSLLLESTLYDDITYTANDFYVFWINDIEPANE